MPTTYKRAGRELREIASEILCKYDTHKPLLDARVNIDYLWAYGEQDDKGRVIVPAIVRRGHVVLGLTRKTTAKERAAGRADAEITLDADWWKTASEKKRAALLDHELHHIAAKPQEGGFATDSNGRPVIKLRNHDDEFGWFRVIAERHGRHSLEYELAAHLMDDAGQYYWPELIALIAPTSVKG